MKDKTLPDGQRQALLAGLQARFESNMGRHEGVAWADVQAALALDEGKLWPLHRMEETGGQPDVVGRDGETGALLFMDCSPQSPAGRVNLCYDDAALESRKANKPKGSAVGMAAAMGIALLTEAQYRALQALGEFDTKTSSWVQTPQEVRALGGAIFGDRRYGRVFLYHNGAESYYGSRGFRGVLRV